MVLEKQSPCKVNLLLNILGRRPDGFHELETVFYPVRVFDRLTFARQGQGVELRCTAPGLPTDARNLVHRAAALFLKTAGIRDGVRLELDKRIPLAAGLHRMRIEQFEKGGDDDLQLWIAGPGMKLQPVPGLLLYSEMVAR